MKVVFIVPLLSQPRCIKRIKAIHEAGYECIVYGYNRGNYDCNQYPSGVKVNEFPEILKDGKERSKKFSLYRKNIKTIFQEQTEPDTLFYTFGFLQSVIVKQYKRPYVYENSDILYGYPKYNGIQWIFKLIDKSIIKKSYFTVLTSEGFANYFGLNKSNIIVQPNKLDQSLSVVNRKVLVQNSDSIKFGFVGAIRYDSVFRFAEVIGKDFPKHEFHFYGASSPEIMQRCNQLTNKYSNIVSHGMFKNPDDLEAIYQNVDVVVACYDTNSLNERIAEPNKLYEAMYFCRPIIVSSGTFLSQQVKHYDCGYIINPKSEALIKDCIKTITSADLLQISSREFELSKDELLDSPGDIIDFLQSYEISQRNK